MNLIGEKVLIRNIKLGDAVLIAKWQNDRFIKRMALAPQHKTRIEDERRDIKNAVRSKSQLYLIITLRESSKPIGYIRINWLDKRESNAWLRFVLGESRKKGFARDAVYTLLRYLFSKNLHRVDAEVYKFNKRSAKLLRRLGFRIEGVRRKAHFDGKKYYDVVMLGLLKQDFGSGTKIGLSRKVDGRTPNKKRV